MVKCIYVLFLRFTNQNALTATQMGSSAIAPVFVCLILNMKRRKMQENCRRISQAFVSSGDHVYNVDIPSNNILLLRKRRQRDREEEKCGIERSQRDIKRRENEKREKVMEMAKQQKIVPIMQLYRLSMFFILIMQGF